MEEVVIEPTLKRVAGNTNGHASLTVELPEDKQWTFEAKIIAKKSEDGKYKLMGVYEREGPHASDKRAKDVDGWYHISDCGMEHLFTDGCSSIEELVEKAENHLTGTFSAYLKESDDELHKYVIDEIDAEEERRIVSCDSVKFFGDVALVHEKTWKVDRVLT